MIDFFKNLFPRKVSSLKEFIGIVREDNCIAVMIKQYTASRSSVRTMAFDSVGTFHYDEPKLIYGLELTTTTPKGKKVVYKEELFERFGGDVSNSGVDDHRKALIRQILLGEQRAKKLRDDLPGVQVDHMGPEDKLMDETTYSQFREDAEALNICLANNSSVD